MKALILFIMQQTHLQSASAGSSCAFQKFVTALDCQGALEVLCNASDRYKRVSETQLQG